MLPIQSSKKEQRTISFHTIRPEVGGVKFTANE